MTGPPADDLVRPVGILCAIPEELRLLADALSDERIIRSAQFDAFVGRLDGVDVVIAAAGIGKMHAASAATALLERFDCPALVISGVAGAVSDKLDVGDVVVARRVVDVDYGRLTDEGRIVYKPGTMPLPYVEPDAGYDIDPGLADDIETALLPPLPDAGSDAPGRPRIHLGTIVSGDTFVASPRYRDELAERWSADAVEMEGAAVCGVAQRYGRPWLIVRALSDRAGEDSSLDFETFLASAAAASARVVRALTPVLWRHARAAAAAGSVVAADSPSA